MTEGNKTVETNNEKAASIKEGEIQESLDKAFLRERTEQSESSGPRKNVEVVGHGI